jgi:orotidine-5'-phosphate decarboxylase
MAERLLYTALDHNDAKSNLDLAQSLSTDISRANQPNSGFKINLDHVYKWGTGYIDNVKEFGRPVFVDLKMNNGERTMGNIVEDLVKKEVQHVNVWALADRLIIPLAEITKGSNTKLLAVTVTTHFDDKFCQKNFGRNLQETVRHFAKIGIDYGCDGIIIPGTTLDAVSDIDCIKLVPGIRPVWYKDKKANNQEQTVTPTEAIKGGANILVCGSPIYKSDYPPQEAMALVYEEMLQAA